jgi:hypothetical protein
MELEALPEMQGMPLLRRPFVGGSVAHTAVDRSMGRQSQTSLSHDLNAAQNIIEERDGVQYINNAFLSSSKSVKNLDMSFKELIDSILR